MARPTKMTEEKIRQLKAICRLKPTLEDCGAFLELHTDTIDKWIKRTHGISFSEFRSQHMVHSRFMITRELLKQCEKGNLGALIWMDKQFNGRKEDGSDDESQLVSIVVNGNKP
jgi:hypothetical protein